MDRSNSILKYLKRKYHEQGEENNTSGSGVGSNVNENPSQSNGGNEGEANMHSKSGGNGSSSGDQSLNDFLVCYIEKDVSDSISSDSIMYRFQKMKNHKGQL